jgi:hypothetical protein
VLRHLARQPCPGQGFVCRVAGLLLALVAEVQAEACRLILPAHLDHELPRLGGEGLQALPESLVPRLRSFARRPAACRGGGGQSGYGPDLHHGAHPGGNAGGEIQGVNQYRLGLLIAEGFAEDPGQPHQPLEQGPADPQRPAQARDLRRLGIDVPGFEPGDTAGIDPHGDGQLLLGPLPQAADDGDGDRDPGEIRGRELERFHGVPPAARA